MNWSFLVAAFVVSVIVGVVVATYKRRRSSPPKEPR